MYKISIIDKESSMENEIRTLNVWEEHSEFELAGCESDEANGVGYIKESNSAMVIINAAGRSADTIPLIADIRRTMPEVYIVLAGLRNDFEYVRAAFISGVFDCMLLPINNKSLKNVLMRMYSDTGSKYAAFTAGGLMQPLVDAVCRGDSAADICREIVGKIYSEFEDDAIAGYIVSEKVKTYAYDEIMSRMAWLKKLVYKNNFVHKIASDSLSEDEVCREWIKHFGEVAEVVRKYSVINNSLISNIGYYVLNHVDEQLSLENVSNGVFLNKSYISHIFKKISGKSFVNFITDVKIDRAKILLKDPSIKIYELAAIISYNNPEYFSRVFKLSTGVTPNRYRNEINVSEQNESSVG
jgi:two-component system response regulator YesN